MPSCSLLLLFCKQREQAELARKREREELAKKREREQLAKKRAQEELAKKRAQEDEEGIARAKAVQEAIEERKKVRMFGFGNRQPCTPVRSLSIVVCVNFSRLSSLRISSLITHRVGNPDCVFGVFALCMVGHTCVRPVRPKRSQKTKLGLLLRRPKKHPRHAGR